MINLLSGGAVIAALAVVAVWAKIRRQRRIAAGLSALNGKVVLITGASSGLGEGQHELLYQRIKSYGIVLGPLRFSQSRFLFSKLLKFALKPEEEEVFWQFPKVFLRSLEDHWLMQLNLEYSS